MDFFFKFSSRCSIYFYLSVINLMLVFKMIHHGTYYFTLITSTSVSNRTKNIREQHKVKHTLMMASEENKIYQYENADDHHLHALYDKSLLLKERTCFTKFSIIYENIPENSIIIFDEIIYQLLFDKKCLVTN